MQQLNGKTKVNIHQLEEKFRSKKELYTFLQHDCRAFLPNLDSTNVYFLRQILKGQKEYLKRNDVKVAAVPLIEGLTVRDFLKYAEGKASLTQYLPDERDWVHIDKSWVCNVLYTLDHEGIQDMIDTAQQTRKDKLEVKRDLTIEMRPEFAEALNKTLSFSCKVPSIQPTSVAEKGKSVGLLKDSSRRKRRREELEEVKQEESLLKEDRQSYLQNAKRMKAENEQMQQSMDELKKLQDTLQKLKEDGIIDGQGQPLMRQ